MPNFIVLEVDNVCKEYDFEIYTACLPRLTDCFPQNEDGLIASCDSVWFKNLSCPADFPTGIKYEVDDSPMLQFRFHSFDKCPNAIGLTLEMYTCDGTLISDDPDDFLSDYVHGVDTNLDNYQTLVIDTNSAAVLANPCFYIKAKDANDIEYCSQLFQLVDECTDTIEIESKPKNDCLGNYYGKTFTGCYGGTNDFAFSNKTRYAATLKQTGTSVDDGLRLFYYTLIFNEALPPFLNNYLSLVHLGYDFVFIDGEQYEIQGVPRIQPRDNSSMFYVKIDLVKVCRGKGCK
jgi:hypothetical protein